jgi:hypothetical protein
VGGEINSEIGRATDAQIDAQQREKQRQLQVENDVKTLWGEKERKVG